MPAYLTEVSCHSISGLRQSYNYMCSGTYYLIIGALSFRFTEAACHAPNPGPTRLADSNQFPRRETIYWDSLPDFFFLDELVPVGVTHIL